MIRLDSGYVKQKKVRRDGALRKQKTTSPLDVNNVICTAKSDMKSVEERNSQVKEEVRRQISHRQFSRSPLKTVLSPKSKLSSNSQPFSIEQFFAQKFAQSQLKQRLASSSTLIPQKSRIENTLIERSASSRELGLDTGLPWGDYNLNPDSSIDESLQARHFFSKSKNKQQAWSAREIKEPTSAREIKQPKSAHLIKHHSPVPHLFHLTNISATQQPLNKSYILNSPSISMKSVKSTRRIIDQDMTATTASERFINSRPGSSSHMQLPSCLTIPEQVKVKNFSQIGSPLLKRTLVKVEEISQSTSLDLAKTSQELIPTAAIGSNQEFPTNELDMSTNVVPETSRQGSSMSKVVYSIDNKQIQSVSEFMFQLNKFQTVMRFENKLNEKERKKRQIDDVQRILSERSETAKKEIAAAKVRKFVRSHNIDIAAEDLNKWVDEVKETAKQMSKAEQVNQKFTYRETNRQIVSFQLKGSEEDKTFWKIQKEIDMALNKINTPIKFANQFQMHMNKRAKNYQQKQMPTTSTSAVGIINRLPDKYLSYTPPPEFFQQQQKSSKPVKTFTPNTSIVVVNSPNAEQSQIVQEDDQSLL